MYTEYPRTRDLKKKTKTRYNAQISNFRKQICCLLNKI